MSPILGLTLSLAAATLLIVTPAAFAAGTENCNAPIDPKLKGSAMSEKLKRCNGVLKPGKAADPDIIIPAPKIDDPLTIHPKQVPGSEATPK
jgi:hypothetical protein